MTHSHTMVLTDIPGVARVKISLVNKYPGRAGTGKYPASQSSKNILVVGPGKPSERVNNFAKGVIRIPGAVLIVLANIP